MKDDNPTRALATQDKGPGSTLEVCFGNRKGLSMSARHDGRLIEQGKPGEGAKGVSGVLSGWSRLAVLTSLTGDAGRKTQRFFWIEPGEEESSLEIGPFHVRGRFKVAREEKSSRKARESWKQARARLES